MVKPGSVGFSLNSLTEGRTFGPPFMNFFSLYLNFMQLLVGWFPGPGFPWLRSELFLFLQLFSLIFYLMISIFLPFTNF